jgi:hypothetical protein
MSLTRRRTLFALASPLAAGLSVAQQKYTGPKPPKDDLPYLLQASKLIETEVGEAKEERKKDDVTYVVSGTSSPAKTPMAEPIFLMSVKSISAERMQLYKMEVRNGRREVLVPARKRGSTRPLHLTVNRVSDALYRIEANEFLQNGQYSLTPDGSNQVFCFEVY